MQKNVASQKAIFFAFDATTNLPKTGDAANITPYESIDYGSVTGITDTSMTEMDATNAKGYYICDLTQGETNGNEILFSAKSSTANIVVVGVPAKVVTVPAAFIIAAGAAGGLAIVGSAMTLSSGERDSAADALLARNVAGGSSAGRLVKEALYVLRNKTDIAGGTLTVYGVDDTTPAFTAGVQTTAGNPISQIDPA